MTDFSTSRKLKLASTVICTVLTAVFLIAAVAFPSVFEAIADAENEVSSSFDSSDGFGMFAAAFSGIMVGVAWIAAIAASAVCGFFLIICAVMTVSGYTCEGFCKNNAQELPKCARRMRTDSVVKFVLAGMLFAVFAATFSFGFNYVGVAGILITGAVIILEILSLNRNKGLLPKKDERN